MPFEGAIHSALSAVWFLVKCCVVILVFFWIRGTYPRLRIDQLMAFGWKMLVPLSFINIVITGVVLFYGLHWAVLTLISLSLLAATFYVIKRYPGTDIERMTVRVYTAHELRSAAPGVPVEAPTAGGPAPGSR